MAQGIRRLIPASDSRATAADRAAEMIAAVIRRYETEQPRPDAPPTDRAFLAWYRSLLQQIGQQVGPEIQTVQALDALFRRVYIPMSLRFGVIPKIIDFCLFSGIDINTIYRGIDNNSPYADMVSQWSTLCREYLLQTMLDSNNSNVNHIFIAKAVYGLSDQPRPITDGPKKAIKQDRDSIIAELTGNVENLNGQNE